MGNKGGVVNRLISTASIHSACTCVYGKMLYILYIHTYLHWSCTYSKKLMCLQLLHRPHNIIRKLTYLNVFLNTMGVVPLVRLFISGETPTCLDLA